MIGCNKIEMCQAEMNCAIETYLNDYVFQNRSPCEVKSVTVKEGLGRTFEINIVERLGEEHT